jgi:galactokinase
MPMPALKPVSTGTEIKLATKPSRNTAASTNNTPTTKASVAAATTRSSRSPLGATLASSDAVSIAIVDVALTLSGRDVPSTAYTSIGTRAVYRPTSTGRPAMEAYAMAWGMTTAAAVRPAIRSSRSHPDE